ncbi:hypothetical protein [Sphingomonas rhizophila]|uniref:hypothetical protein n=1 Tax=Sphingomonas rhizophila TaxID=2071607 RepID=UPI001FE7D82C|nr:hypothetical protein [Sphingomonas rhizophila]
MTSTSDWHPYCGEAPIPPDWLWRWNFDVALLMVLGAIGLRAWRIAEESSQRRMLLGAAGICLLLFISPFCALTSALFSARVAHHVILAAVLAPLIVHALPAGTTRWPGSLAVWTAVQAIAFWLWHAPGFYAAALSSDVIYWLMQVTITGRRPGSGRRCAGPNGFRGSLPCWSRPSRWDCLAR